jgi:hypothetical protein
VRGDRRGQGLGGIAVANVAPQLGHYDEDVVALAEKLPNRGLHARMGGPKARRAWAAARAAS